MSSRVVNVSGPEGLRLLAAWFDARDAREGANGDNVQRDLRKWAYDMERAAAEIADLRAQIDFDYVRTYHQALADLAVRDDEIARLVGADHENYDLTAEVQVLREENERLREALAEVRSHVLFHRFARCGLPHDCNDASRIEALRIIDRALDGEKEGNDAS